MTGLGLAATAAAFLNYQRAKKNYDQVQERTEGVNLVVNRYQDILAEYYERRQEEADKHNPRILTEQEELEALELGNTHNVRPEGVQVGVLVRVGNLVGKLLRTETTLIISNTSSREYYLFGVYVDNTLFDVPGFWPMDWKAKTPLSKFKYIEKPIKPGETMEVIFPKGVTTAVHADASDGMDDLRNMICKVNGKQLITSCGKTNLDDLVVSSVLLFWAPMDQKEEMVKEYSRLYQDDYEYIINHQADVNNLKCMSEDGVIARAGKSFDLGRWLSLPAILRYCGEAYL